MGKGLENVKEELEHVVDLVEECLYTTDLLWHKGKDKRINTCLRKVGIHF